MDADYVLVWMVGTGALLGVLRAGPALRLRIKGPLIVNGLLLAVIGLGLLLGLPGVGYGSFALWTLFVLAPGLVSRRIQDAANRNQLRRAAFWARILGWLHPFDEARTSARMWRFEQALSENQVQRAKEAMQPLLESKAFSEIARMNQLRADGNFAAIAAHYRSQTVGTRDVRLAHVYLGALGDTGDVEGMWALYASLPRLLADQAITCLRMAGYSGLLELTEQILRDELSHLPESVKRLWRGIALQVIGRIDDADALLVPLSQSREPGFATAERRLKLELRPVDLGALSERARFQIERVTSFSRDRRVAVGVETRRPYLTWALTASFALVFAITQLRSESNLEALIEMGALVLPTDLVQGGVAWRIVAAGFLHLDWVHWALNSVGIWLIGAAVERHQGRWVMLVVFLGSSIGAYSAAWLLADPNATQPHVLIGASAGLMGLVGAMGSHAALGYGLAKNRILAQRLRGVLLVIALQMVFDWFTPIVSSFLHLWGAALGFLIAAPFSWWSLRRVMRKRVAAP